MHAKFADCYVGCAERCMCVPWQTFFLKEKLASLSGDDFDILDGNNNPAFKMQASALSLTEKRVLKNAQNQPVCSLKKKVSNKFG